MATVKRGVIQTPFADAVCKPKGGTTSPAPAQANTSGKGKK